MNDSTLDCYVDKQRGWINEAFMDGVIWADNNRPVDWQQVRIQSAIAAMQGIISNEVFLQDIEKLSKDTASVRERTAIISVEYSNVLVKELKGE